MTNTLVSTLFLTVVIVNLWIVVNTEVQKCKWYGECNIDSNCHKQNCPYDGPPKSLTDETSLFTLKKWCPHFFEANTSIWTCCDKNQLETMDKNLVTAAALLKRCPSCMQNFLRHICDYTCGPNQDLFLNITGIGNNETTNKSYISAVDLYISNNYTRGTYNSCKSVSMPSSGQLVLDIMCGAWGASECSPTKWFQFLGDAQDNMYVPFQINYKFLDKKEDNFIPLNPAIVPCNQAINENATACSCVDCEASCPAPPPVPQPITHRTLFGYDRFVVIVLIVYGITSFIFLVISCCCLRSKMSTSEETDSSPLPGFAIPANVHVTDLQGDEHDPLLRGRLKNASVLYRAPMSCWGRFEARIGSIVDKAGFIFFQKWGVFCAHHPWWVLCTGAIIVAALGYGIRYLHVTTDPVDLWASPWSRSRVEKEIFDSNFEPFYRTEQVILRSVGLLSILHNTSEGIVEYGPVFHEKFLLSVLELQQQIQSLGQKEGFGLEKICYAPLSSPFTGPVELSQCVVQSIWGYYQNSIDNFNDTDVDPEGFTTNYLDTFKKCSQNPYNDECIAPYGGPVDPAIALGGFLKLGETLVDQPNYGNATAVILTFLVNNHKDKSKLTPALEWEKLFVTFMKKWTANKPDYMDVAFSSERSIEDELERSSHSDVSTIIISYLTMFLYIAISLGHFRGCSRFFVDSKITLGLGGVVIVLSSVMCSVGFFGYVGVPATLIIIEVIPFLVLAVGVDNIFILVQAHQREGLMPEESCEQHIGRTLGAVGPSMLLTTLSECGCFFLGGLSGMPAVRAFAMYAGMALLIDFIFQITCFVSLLALDSKRQLENRFDICCCFISSNTRDDIAQEAFLYKFFKKYYAPFLMSNPIRTLVVLLFWGLLCISFAVTPKIEVGLDQELSMPEDSHVYKYFVFLKDYLSIGPPVYFVVGSGMNYSNRTVQNLICGGQFCESDSLTTQLYIASKQQNVTYIARGASSWLDDYFDWSSLKPCCNKFPGNHSYCPRDTPGCVSCDIPLNKFNRPEGAMNFNHYLSFFLQDNPNGDCAKGGHAAYSQAVKRTINKENYYEIKATYFMTYHTVLKTSEDYYHALQSARMVAANISRTLNSALNDTINSAIEVFPYSVFYVFYEQYLTMWHDTLGSLAISLTVIFFITFIVGLSIISSLIVVITILMIVMNIFGLMYWWNISLNAVSLVNLVMTVGISVEFCSHIVHYFVNSPKISRVKRAQDALTNMGTSVFQGITLTKFFGVFVLGFAHSKIFKVFYFKMYLGIIIFGAIHGLIFLPVFLSYLGPTMIKSRLVTHRTTGYVPIPGPHRENHNNINNDEPEEN